MISLEDYRGVLSGGRTLPTANLRLNSHEAPPTKTVFCMSTLSCSLSLPAASRYGRTPMCDVLMSSRGITWMQNLFFFPYKQSVRFTFPKQMQKARSFS